MSTIETTIPSLFSAKANEFRNNIVFHYFDGEWKSIPYHKFLAATKSIASYLIKSGIRKGDRMAILSENRHEWCEAYLAISMTGGIAVPIDAQLGTDEIWKLLSDSAARTLFHSSKAAESIKEVTDDVSLSHGSGLVRINFDSEEFMTICHTPQLSNYPEVSGEDIASIIYTSGTTGIPKGVLLSHRNFCADVQAILQIGLIEAGDNFISILPYHHTYPFMGNLILPISSGLTVTFPPSLKGPELLATIREKGVTILVGVPQLLELIRNGIVNKIKHLPAPLPEIMLWLLKICGKIRIATGINPGRVIFKSAHRALGKKFRFFASGGAKLNPEVMLDLEALGFTVLEGFGLTETSPVVTFNSPHMKRKPGSAGKSLPTAEIKIISPETHREAGNMEEGEVVIRGPMVMKGYYKNPGETQQVLRDSWFYSGDLGYLDDDGYLFITGRLKEVIVLSSGKNIYPDEVEKQYSKIPLIKEICVMGLEENGIIESLQAVIVPDFEYAKKAQIGNLQEALKWEINSVSLHLPQYMRIRGYTLNTDPLPRTPLGKLRRFMVKDLIKAKSERLKVKNEIDIKLLEDPIGSKVVECLTPLLKEKINIQSADNLELDLGLDSLARIELVVALEEAFPVKLPETFASEIQTVQELVTKMREYGASGIGSIEKVPMWKDILSREPDADDKEKVRFRHGLAGRLIRFSGLAVIKIIVKVFFRLKVEGIENLPKDGPYIITPNHASYLDGFIVASALPQKPFSHLYILGLQNFFTGRLKESFAKIAHVIPIDTELYLSKALLMSSYILRQGKSLLVFPEGGRSSDGELMDFKKGVGILSAEINIPVVPAGIRGSFEALPKGAMWPRFREIRITFGKPLYPGDVDLTEKPGRLDNYQFLANTLRKRVKELKKIK
jgi:long-chain acyl-CoA synthetase